jgi:hypothetical protein
LVCPILLSRCCGWAFSGDALQAAIACIAAKGMLSNILEVLRVEVVHYRCYEGSTSASKVDIPLNDQVIRAFRDNAMRQDLLSTWSALANTRQYWIFSINKPLASDDGFARELIGECYGPEWWLHCTHSRVHLQK